MTTSAGSKTDAEPGWRPAARTAALRQRAAMLARARAFFAGLGVLEVQTPVLSRHAIPTPGIESFEVHGARRYLRTSPELAHKRLLAAGTGDLYEIGPVFRAGEQGARHNPEFTLLEWYRIGVDEHALMDEVAQLVALLVPALALPPVRLTWADAFSRYAGIDVWHADEAELRAAVARLTRPPETELTREQWLDLLLALAVAPRFSADRLTFVHDYPADQAVLAEISASDPRVARRFEAFAGAVELANGFFELRDACEQRARFERDNANRRAAGAPEHEPDAAFLAALEAGLPACAGVAVGFDRLVMLACRCDDVASTLAFDWARA